MEQNILEVTPKAWGSPRSRLADVLLNGHPDTNGVPRLKMASQEIRRVLAWIDLNVPYYGTSETTHPETVGCRRIYPAELDAKLADVAKRRCSECHDGGKIPRQFWTRLVNPKLNSYLLAPLKKEAGGSGACAKAVFTSTADPDYQAILRHLRPRDRPAARTPAHGHGGRRSGRCGSVVFRELVLKSNMEPVLKSESGRQAHAPLWSAATCRNAVYDGDLAKADQLIAGVRERVLADVAQVEQQFAGADDVSGYVGWWRKRAKASAADWKALLASRQAELQNRIAEYSRTIVPTDQMLKGLTDPPMQVGTGVWEGHNHLLATVLPEPREVFWGEWIGGLYEKGSTRAAVFALSKHERVNANSFCELPVNIPVSGRRDRLALLVYLADTTKESCGLGYAKWRWSGYRSIRLLWGERELWQADLGKKFADPGRLARAIITMDERHPKVYSVVKYVGVRSGKNRNDERGAWYAPIVEFKGGRGGRGQGFMTRSINAQADGRIYAKSLATNVEKLAK